MALPKGAIAPQFKLPSSNGGDFAYPADAQGKPILLFFYPKNETRVCTQEACSFRDRHEQFLLLGVQVVGISRDSLESHKAFVRNRHLPYPLLSDEDGRVSKLYDAKIPLVGLSRRVTYLIGPKGKIEEVYDRLFEGEGHITHMLAYIHKHGLVQRWAAIPQATT